MRTFISALVVAVLLVAGPVPASAQEGTQRAMIGFFERADPNAAQSLVVEGSIGGGWDTSIAADIEDVATRVEGEPIPLKGAAHSTFDAKASYSARGRKLGFGASAAGNGRYYPSFVNPVFVSSSGKVGLDYRFTDATQLRGSLDASYQPFGTLNVFPSTVQQTELDPTIAPRIDLRASSQDYWAYRASTVLSQTFARRNTVSVEASYGFSDYSSAGFLFGEDFEQKGGAARFARSISRTMTLDIGYGFQQTQYVVRGERNVRDHNASMGLRWEVQRGRSRRTTASFDVGATYLEEANVIRRRAAGSATLSHELARTWLIGAAYTRDADVLPTLREPFFSDAASIFVVGLLGSRVQVDGNVGASNGALGLVTEDQARLRTYYASVGPSIALTRHLRGSVRYDYYFYRFSGDPQKYRGFLPELNRHSVVASISMWAPIFQRGQRNASR